MNSQLNCSPLIIAGMHRSGTSWAASLLEEAGINLGSNQVQADLNNQRGYFEDLDFLALNQKILNSCLIPTQSSYIDWGWSESLCIDSDALQQFKPEAIQLLKTRESVKTLWGWKDPRSTVLLNFWQELVPNAKYIFVYRYPWEVADSMQRLGAAVFLDNPLYAFKIWEFYNRRILEFYSQNQEHCLLLSTNSLALKETDLCCLINSKFGFSHKIENIRHKFDSALFKAGLNSKVAFEIYKIAFPSVVDLLLELDQKADLPSQIQDSPVSSLRFNRSWKGEDSKPKVSVVIPCFNQGVFLPEALVSVESYAPLETEVLVTNDGSTNPETLAIVSNLENAGYQVVSQTNQGLSKTRNRMVEMAQADIILPLDADNRICANFIREGLRLFDSLPQIGIVYGNRVDFGMRRGEVDVPQFEVGTMLQENYIDACALIRKSVIEACGGYDSNVKALEDWELWVHAAAKGFEFAKLQFNTLEYRVRPTSMVSFINDPQNKNDIVEYVQQKHFRFYISWLDGQATQLRKQLAEYEERLKQIDLNQQILSAQQAKLEQQVEQKEQELSASQSEVSRLDQALTQIQSSKSWQVTAPLRDFFSILRRG